MGWDRPSSPSPGLIIFYRSWRHSRLFRWRSRSRSSGCQCRCLQDEDENEYMEALCQVRLVSWDWHRLTTEFFSREELKTMSVDVTFISRKKTLELRRQVTLRSAYLREFTALSLSWLRLPSPDQVRAEWTTLSSHMPKLRQLDLMEITNVPSLYLGIITDAVSAQRPALEGLHLAPVHESTIPQDRTIVQCVITCIIKRGELCWLTMSGIPGPGNRAMSSFFVQSLSNWTPNLEKLTGIRTEVDYDGSILCEDEWFIDLATWDLFCQSHLRLVTFHWVVAPFATELFEAFAKYPKPHLVGGAIARGVGPLELGAISPASALYADAPYGSSRDERPPGVKGVSSTRGAHCLSVDTRNSESIRRATKRSLETRSVLH